MAKDCPLVENPNLPEASIYELLEALKLPEDWSRSHAKQLLKERGANAVIPVLQKWISQLDKKNPDYEHHLLEALWVYESLGVVNEELLLTLVNSENHNARAAGLRALQFWRDELTNVLELLEKTVLEEHPQVRLESVIALRKVHLAEAARAALSVLEYPTDEFLDYALWQTVRELDFFLMERLKADPDFLGSAEKTVYAFKSMSDPDAIAHLVQLYQRELVPEEYHKDVINSIGRWGQKEDLNILFDMAVQDYSIENENVSAKLDALVEAARQRDISPDRNINRIVGFLGSDDEEVVLNAVRLVGHWRMEEMSGELVDLIHKRDLSIKRVAMDALASLKAGEAEELFIGMATESEKNSFNLRFLATAQLVK